MVDLAEEKAFWLFIAEKNSYVQHKPNGNKLAGELRFAAFNDQGTIGEATALGSPRLELRDNPTGFFGDNKAGYHYDNMSRVFRIIGKCKQNDFADKEAVQQACKAAIAEIIRYIIQQQEDGDTCANNILKLFDADNVRYEIIENATSDGSFTGCQCMINFRTHLDTATPVAYGTFEYP